MSIIPWITIGIKVFLVQAINFNKKKDEESFIFNGCISRI
jgi:hypothetical protein